jgi:AAA family ATP:ADP antiporter
MPANSADRRKTSLISELLGVEKHEYVAVAWSAAFFFCILSSYYIIRPVRETMAVGSGTNTIPILFTSVFLVMMIATTVFGWIASRYPRRIFLPWLYAFFVTNILAFWIVFSRLVSDGDDHVWLGRIFFVWLGVFNAFVVTVFWSFMADIYTREQGRRLFGMITAAGSLGAFLGSASTSAIVLIIGFHNLFLPSAVLLSVSLLCISRLGRWIASSDSDELSEELKDDEALGGSPLSGITHAFSAKYFIAIMAISVLASLLGNALYVFGIDLVREAIPTEDERTRFFSNLNVASTAIAAFVQLLVVKSVVRRFGVGRAIAILPALWAVGFLILAFDPVLAVAAVFTFLARGLGFGFSKPTNHMLYSVVTPEEKYKVKNFIDTAIFRFGDSVASWLVIALMGLGIVGVSLLMVPFAIVAGLLAVWLGREYKRRAKQLNDSGVA